MGSVFNFESPMRSGINKENAKVAHLETRAAASLVDVLDADVERLFMLTEALWVFMQKEHGYTEEQLIEKIVEIDLRDGKLDGRSATDAPLCTSCNRPVSKQRPVCPYCGTQVEASSSPFER